MTIINWKIGGNNIGLLFRIIAVVSCLVFIQVNILPKFLATK
jgi:hypothetical protein